MCIYLYIYIFLFIQEVPEELYQMAERHKAWKGRRANDKHFERADKYDYNRSSRNRRW